MVVGGAGLRTTHRTKDVVGVGILFYIFENNVLTFS